MHLCTKHLHAGLCESRARMTVQICVEGCRVPQGNCDRWHECFRKVEGILTSSTCRENHAGAKRAESSPVGDRLLLFTKETPLLERSHPCFFLSSVWRRHLFCPQPSSQFRPSDSDCCNPPGVPAGEPEQTPAARGPGLATGCFFHLLSCQFSDRFFNFPNVRALLQISPIILGVSRGVGV